MKSIDVAVGIILDSSRSKVLVAQRQKNDEHLGQWEFPGGKIDGEESAKIALKRELKEELGVEVISCEFFQNLYFEYTQQKVNLYFYIVIKFFGQPTGKEGQKVEWIHIKNLHQLNMLEANKTIINKLQANFPQV